MQCPSCEAEQAPRCGSRPHSAYHVARSVWKEMAGAASLKKAGHTHTPAVNTMMSLRSSQPISRSQHRAFSGQNRHVILGRRCAPKACAESNDDASGVSRRQLTLAGILVALMPAVAQPAQACERTLTATHTPLWGHGTPPWMPIVCPVLTSCPPSFFCSSAPTQYRTT